MLQASKKTLIKNMIAEQDAGRSDLDRVVFTWHGCAHYHIRYKGRRIVIDPLYHRPKGDTPHLGLAREEIDRVDYLLLTHAHMDHSWDFPYLAARHQPQAYGPGKYLACIQKKGSRRGLAFNPSRLHALEKVKGQCFLVDDIEVTPYQIGTEQIDWWFIRTMLIRPYRHVAFAAMSAGNSFLLHHLKDNCFGYHFRFPASGRSMLYIGNLTDQVDELAAVDRVHVLALPYCPANKRWLVHTLFLIGRFAPDVILVHHYDNFWHPYTHPRYRDLNGYQRTVKEKYPDADVYFSRFLEDVDFEQLASPVRQRPLQGEGSVNFID